MGLAQKPLRSILKLFLPTVGLYTRLKALAQAFMNMTSILPYDVTQLLKGLQLEFCEKKIDKLFLCGIDFKYFLLMQLNFIIETTILE